MSLHCKMTLEMNRWAMRQRVARAICSAAISAGLLGVGLMGLNTLSPAAEPVYSPQFILMAENSFITFGGSVICPVPSQVQRKPTPPMMMMRPLGLAPRNEATPPAEFSDVELPTVEFGDWLEFCWGEASCGSFD